MKQKDALETYGNLARSRVKRPAVQESCRSLQEIAYLLIGGLFESLISLTDRVELLWCGADYLVDLGADLFAGLRRRHRYSHNDSGWTQLPQCGNCNSHG